MVLMVPTLKIRRSIHFLWWNLIGRQGLLARMSNCNSGLFSLTVVVPKMCLHWLIVFICSITWQLAGLRRVSDLLVTIWANMHDTMILSGDQVWFVDSNEGPLWEMKLLCMQWSISRWLWFSDTRDVSIKIKSASRLSACLPSNRACLTGRYSLLRADIDHDSQGMHVHVHGVQLAV